MKINLKKELEGFAALYDEMLKNDPRLRAELEAKDRILRDKEDAKRKEKNEREKSKKKLKKKMRSRSRSRWI
jgi:hypothetical protein